MLTDQLFTELVNAASLAPSADNMQPWEFRKQGDSIEVFCVKSRILPTDVISMFAWIGVGAAIQNIVVKAMAHGLVATVEYQSPKNIEESAAVIRFFPSNLEGHMAESINIRTTNRSPYKNQPLEVSLISKLSQSIQGLEAGIHWTTTAANLNLMASMDARSTYIRLDHKPLHDELFDILRFTPKDMEATRYGLTFASLEVPSFAVLFARQLQYWSVTKVVSFLGFDRLVAKQLSNKLRKAGALCLLTAYQRNPIGYMKAGRAMEQLWLAATAEGLSIQPYGVLPQYLTKVEIEPETFLPKHVATIKSHREPFFSLFPEAQNEYPAIVLRVGWANKQSVRNNIRLKFDQIIHKR